MNVLPGFPCPVFTLSKPDLSKCQVEGIDGTYQNFGFVHLLFNLPDAGQLTVLYGEVTAATGNLKQEVT